MKFTLIPFLVLLFLGLGGCGGGGTTTPPEPQARYLRKNAATPAASKDIEAMQKALDSMRRMDCSNPLSWYYQGGIHAVPPKINGTNQLCGSYQQINQLKEAWDNCTHHNNSSGKPSEIHFLLWHRLYIWHFEKIVRKLSGYQAFALPYWDYANTSDPNYLTMPATFRSSGSSLYEPCRLDSLNKGNPISGSVLRRLSTTELFTNKTYRVFNQNIDGAPHGAMHVYIGAGNSPYERRYNRIYQDTLYGLMRSVPSAAFDPIFWLHHAEIDRLWQQWTNSLNGQKVTLNEIDDVEWPYVFFDENGKKVSYTLQQVIDIIYNMNYDYDDTPMTPAQPVAAKQRILMMENVVKEDTIARLVKKQALSKPQNTFSMANPSKPKLKLEGTPGEAGGELLHMSVVVSYAVAPEGSYELYLNLPPGETPTPESPYFTGFMTFFGADHHMELAAEGHHNHGGSTTGRYEQEFLYEITPEVIKSNALQKSAFNITVLKFGGGAKEDVQIERVNIFKE